MKVFNCYLIIDDYYRGEYNYKNHYTQVLNKIFPLITNKYIFNLIDNKEDSDIIICPYDKYNIYITESLKNKKIIFIIRHDAVTSPISNLLYHNDYLFFNTIMFIDAHGFVNKNNYCKIQNNRFFYLVYKDNSYLNKKIDYDIEISRQQCLLPHFLRFYYFYNNNHYFIPFNNIDNKIYTDELFIENIDKMINISNIDFSLKIYDIAFVGFTNYDDNIPNEHRKDLIKFLENLKKNSTYNIYISEKIPKTEMIELMIKTKIFISPWGIGEYSGKDYESILLGCILFKPSFYNNENHYYSYPNIYKQNETCINYKYDNSDLLEKINNVLSDYNNISITFNNNILNMFSNFNIKKIKKDYINYFDNILNEKLLCNSNYLYIELEKNILFLKLFNLCNNKNYINILLNNNNEFKISIKNMSEFDVKNIYSTGIGFKGLINLKQFNIKLDIKIENDEEKNIIYYDGYKYINHEDKITEIYSTIIFKNIYDINKFRFFIDYKQLIKNFTVLFKNISII